MSKNMKKPIDDWRFLLVMSLTLGLAPFYPEPHILGKIRWVAGGARGMGLIDWFDLLFHGWPWLLLMRVGLLHFLHKYQKKNGTENLVQ